jgi:hypothetical protein
MRQRPPPASKAVPPGGAVWQELGRRFGIGGHVEKAARPAKAPEPTE